MSNSFNISVKPEIAAVKSVVDANSVILVDVHDTDLPAAVTKIDANKTVIDENKVILVDIHDTDLPSVATAIGNNLTAIGANNTILADLHDTDLPGAVTKIEAIQTDQFFSIIASDVELAAADTERNHGTSTYTEVKKILIDLTGIYRITFDLKTGTGGEAAFGKIYKNDIAYGTEQSNDTVNYVNKSEDLLFLRGDYAQLYLKISTPPYQAYAQNFKVKGSGGSPVAIVITD